jgi:16S rRNA C1402 N4-methylase RsmH
MNKAKEAKARIRTIIAGSGVQEDAGHAENTLEWLLKLDLEADQALQIAALAHDIERAVEDRRIHREDFEDYEAFKAAHARNSANMLREILMKCGVSQTTSDEACRLVAFHEAGGDPRDLPPSAGPQLMLVFFLLLSCGIS